MGSETCRLHDSHRFKGIVPAADFEKNPLRERRTKARKKPPHYGGLALTKHQEEAIYCRETRHARDGAKNRLRFPCLRRSILQTAAVLLVFTTGRKAECDRSIETWAGF